MKVGDLVTTIEAALGPTGGDFGVALVIGKSLQGIEENVQLLFDDGFIDWYPAWMMKVVQ